MKKVLLYFLIFIALISVGFSQQSDTTLAFVAYWEAGDKKEYEVVKRKTRFQQGAQTEDDSSSYTALFHVLNETDSSYRIRWEYQNQLFDASVLPEDIQDSFEEFSTFNIEYQTDELGEFIEILNWKEISEMMSRVMKSTLSNLGEDTERFETAMEPMMAAYSSKEGIEAVLGKELIFIHFPFGVELNTRDTIVYDEFLPNIFGGDPIRGIGKLYFDSVNLEANYVKFINELSLDPESVSEMIGTMVSTIISRMSEMTEEEKRNTAEMLEMMKSMEIEVNDYNTFEYEYYPGYPIKIQFKRVSNVTLPTGKMKQVDGITINAKE